MEDADAVPTEQRLERLPSTEATETLCTFVRITPSSEATESQKKSTKRKARNQAEWKREKRKRSIIAGEPHVTVRGEMTEQKKIGSDCLCKLKCYEKIDEKTRQMLFDGFYSLKTYDEQNAYLFGLIRKHDVKRKKNALSDRRTCTYKYYIRYRGQETQVCKLAFAHIHAVSFRKIRTLSEKLDQNILFPRDGRGKHDNRPTKIPQETKDLIKNHLFNVIKSNELKSFMKEDKNRQMVPELNVAKLYLHFLRMYECEALNPQTGQLIPGYIPKVKSWLYRKVFHEEVKSKDFQTLKKKLDIFNESHIHKMDEMDLAAKKDRSPKKSRRKGTAKKLSLVENTMIPQDHNAAAKAAEALMFQQKTAGLGCSNVHFPIAPNYNTQGNPAQNIQLQVQRNMVETVKHHQPMQTQPSTLSVQAMNPHQAHTDSSVHHHSAQEFPNTHYHFLAGRPGKEPVGIGNRSMTFLQHSINPQTIGAISHHHPMTTFASSMNDPLQRVRNSAQSQHYGAATGLMHSADANQQLDLSVNDMTNAFYS